MKVKLAVQKCSLFIFTQLATEGSWNEVSKAVTCSSSGTFVLIQNVVVYSWNSIMTAGVMCLGSRMGSVLWLSWNLIEAGSFMFEHWVNIMSEAVDEFEVKEGYMQCNGEGTLAGGVYVVGLVRRALSVWCDNKIGGDTGTLCNLQDCWAASVESGDKWMYALLFARRKNSSWIYAWLFIIIISERW